jgi:hypothetical protein
MVVPTDILQEKFKKPNYLKKHSAVFVKISAIQTAAPVAVFFVTGETCRSFRFPLT